MKKLQINNIYLIGPMGSGKTSVGKCLAKLAKYKLYDSDAEIEKQTGVNIAWIFEREGEEKFREREAKAIASLTTENNIVLSTGGGVVVTESNRKQLRDNGIVVYLQVSVDVQLSRTALRRESRPMLQAYGSRDKLLALNNIRSPLYLEIADLIYNTDNFAPAPLAAAIWQDIKKLRKKWKH